MFEKKHEDRTDLEASRTLKYLSINYIIQY